MSSVHLLIDLSIHQPIREKKHNAFNSANLNTMVLKFVLRFFGYVQRYKVFEKVYRFEATSHQVPAADCLNSLCFHKNPHIKEIGKFGEQSQV